MKTNVKKRYTIGFFLAIFILLLLIYRPSFSNPPRSDYWSAFYFFHLVNASDASPSHLHVLTYDPWQHGTYRPLSFFIIYLEWLVFGAAFTGNHIVSFALYCVNLLLLYKLAMNFSLDRVLTLAFLAVFALLFSHFDIITWTFHVYSLLAFCSLLLGFNLFFTFLRSGRKRLLLPVGLFLLIGMLCYEVFALWPLALIILLFLPRGGEESRLSKISPLASCLILLGAVYFSYFVIFLLMRSIGVYAVGPLLGPRHPITGRSIILSVFAPFFNLVYTGILVNICPAVTMPALVRDNIDMGGLLYSWASKLNGITILTGGIAAVLFLGLGIFLFKKRRLRTLVLMIFLLFLLCSFFSTISLARSITNPLFYVFIQFRYQYVPNAITVLMVLVALNELTEPTRREKAIICLALMPIFLANLYFSNRYSSILKTQLEPLRIMISNIKKEVRRGSINADAKLFIEEGITKTLPALCWNDDMAVFMGGTYQWIFSPEKIDYFTPEREEARWIIRADDYRKIYPAGKE